MCSLGPFGWIGLYQYQAGVNHVKLERALAVVSGLDDQSYALMRLELIELHRRAAPWREALATLDFWREGARLNRRRLLALLRKLVLSDQPDPSAFGPRFGAPLPSLATNPKDQPTPPTEPAPTEPAPTELAQTCAAWVPLKTYPLWFRMPDRAPRDCPPLPPGSAGFAFVPHLREALHERYVRELEPEFDVLLDNACALRDPYVVRRAGCCDSSADVVARLGGPLACLTVVTRDKAAAHSGAGGNSKTVESFESCVAQDTPVVESVAYRLPEDAAYTWENPDIEHNRVVFATYANRAAVGNGVVADALVPVGASEPWYPMCVRVSCVDSTGCAFPPNTRKRMWRFAVNDAPDAALRR